MRAEEKAKELVEKYNKHARFWDCYNDVPLEENHSKQCALICIDEILESYILIPEMRRNIVEYWQEVKQEIEKL